MTFIQPLAFVRTFVLYTIVAVLLVACGGSDGKSAPTESGLRDYLQETISLWQKGDYAKLYSQQSAEFKKECSLGDFMGQMLLANAFLGESLKKAKLEVRDVKIEGAKATYRSHLVVDGSPLTEEDEVEEAIWVDGRWYGTDIGSCGSDSGSSSAASPTPTQSPTLAFGQAFDLSGLKVAVLSIKKGICDRGAAILVEAELENTTEQFNRRIPGVELLSPDNQKLNNFIGFSDPANFYNLPQGLPPQSKTKGLYCIATDGNAGRGTYVGTVPETFSKWTIILGGRSYRIP